MVISTAADAGELEKLWELTTQPALRQAVPFLGRLVRNSAFLETEILPLFEDARNTGAWYVAHRYDPPDGSCSLQIFVWPPQTGTRIHEHSCWGVFCCAVGSLVEERYERLDDESRPDFARLKKIWQRAWSIQRGVSTVLPYEGGIHRVSNPGPDTAISVHLYGPRSGEIDGRDYDPSLDYVCDRRED